MQLECTIWYLCLGNFYRGCNIGLYSKFKIQGEQSFYNGIRGFCIVRDISRASGGEICDGRLHYKPRIESNCLVSYFVTKGRNYSVGLTRDSGGITIKKHNIISWLWSYGHFYLEGHYPRKFDFHIWWNVRPTEDISPTLTLKRSTLKIHSLIGYHQNKSQMSK